MSCAATERPYPASVAGPKRPHATRCSNALALLAPIAFFSRCNGAQNCESRYLSRMCRTPMAPQAKGAAYPTPPR